MEWREDILRDICVLPNVGTPGRIVAFGKHAAPILTGSTEEDVLIAAAEFGKGRIVAISHDGFASNFALNDQGKTNVMLTFHNNLKRWLTKGTLDTENKIISAEEDTSKEKLMSSKIVLYCGGQAKINSSELTEFILNGGALLHCLTPWGWLQLNEGKIVTDAAYVPLLLRAGLVYTDEYLSASDCGFCVEESKGTIVSLMDRHKTELIEWRKDILKDISVLPNVGSPGKIIVCGKRAAPILTGSTEEDVLVAAAEFGKGRIVAISHDGYAANFSRNGEGKAGGLAIFHSNLKRWLTKGTFDTDNCIIDAEEDAKKEKLMSSKIVLYRGGQGKINSADLTEFILNGGALLHCITPWGWLQLNEGKSLSDASYVSLLVKGGIYYTDSYICVPDGGFCVEDNNSVGVNLLNRKKTEENKAIDVSSANRNDAELVGWRQDILKDVGVLPKTGMPGRIIVFGNNAAPILTGSNEENVLVAAAEFGKGRIVAIAHDAYSAHFLGNEQINKNATTVFHNNLKRWLTKGTSEMESSVIDAQLDVSKEKLMSSKIVMYHGGQGKISSADLTEYVRNGGALFHCLTPWGWLQCNNGKTLSDVSYVALLFEAGLCYTDEWICAPDCGFCIEENKASDAHLLRVLEEVGTNFDKAVEKANMLKRLKYLPKGQFLQLNSTVGKIWERCREELEKSAIPSPAKPVKTKRDRAILDLWLLCYDILQPPSIKAPGVNFFPGDFSTQPPLKCCTLEFRSNIQDFYSTACYLPAGQTLKVEVISGNEEQDWELMIGCHTDELQSDELRRWPKLNIKVRVLKKTLELSTPFGGLIYLISPDKPSRSISVKLENVVDAPRFRLTEGEKGKDTWEHSRHSPGLWADIEGEFLAFTLPASSVREMEFDALTSVMKTWDSVVRLYHDLRGTDVSKFRRMWIVTDEQTGAGYMHSGYPILTHLDVADAKGSGFLLNGSILQKEGSWGIFHEIGHNMQRGEWTFEGTGEVTVNIFTLCAMDTICHLKPWIHNWLQGQLNDTAKFLKDGANFEKWKSSAGIALFVYAQLVHEFGWDSYRKVFRRYEAMNQSEKPKDDQTKMDMWFSIFSEVAGVNLSPLASFWGIPLSTEAVARLQAAFPTGFLPDDEVTRCAPDRVDSVLHKFPKIVRDRCS